MNSKTKAAGIALVAAFVALPVFAQTVGAGVGAGVGVNVGGGGGIQAAVDTKIQIRITKGKERADEEVQRRIKILTELNTKVQGMKRVSDSTKASISSTVQAEVGNLSTLDAKIQADSDIETLKADVKSITTSYRIFMLVIPQGRISVAGDRIHTVADSETTFAGKLKTRIDEAAAQGNDVAALNASLSTMTGKIADANIQVDAAVALVANLTPDNGDKAKMDANNAAIKSARAKVKAGMEDLQAAHKAAKSIREGLKVFASASATTTVSTP